MTTKKRPPVVNTDEDRVVQPFAQWLRQQGNGRTHDELSEALHDLLGRCEATGKKGSVTLTVTVEPAKNTDGMMNVRDSISLKLPEFDRPIVAYWMDETGNLVRSDPRQPSLEGLHEVPDVDYDTGEILTDRKAK